MPHQPQAARNCPDFPVPAAGETRRATGLRWRLPLLAAASALVAAAAPAPPSAKGLAPFEIVDRVIYVQGTIDGSRPLWFLVSSGSAGSALDAATARELGLAPGPGQSRAGPARFAIGAAELPIEKLSVMDLSGTEDLVGHEIDAVIGYDLFKRYIVEIDYYGQILRLHDPASYRPDPRAAALPIRIEGNRAYLRTGVKLAGRERFSREYALDTGIGGALIEEEVKQASSPKLEVVGESGGEPFGITLTRTEAVDIGPYTFRGANGISGGRSIGGEFLRRFTTVFDYGKRRLFLLPNRHYDDKFCFEMLGVELSIARAAGGLRMDAVYRGSTAERAGLKVGDILTAIDGRPSLDIPLGQVRMMFGQQNSYVLHIRSGSSERVIPVTLNASL